jgi:hypothetical protein
VTVNLAISSCSSINFCLTYFNAVKSLYIKDCYVILENLPLYYNMHF